MSDTNFNSTATPRDGRSLSLTPKGFLRMNCVRLNANAGKEGASATLPMGNLVEYSYLTADGCLVVKFWDKPELRFYPAEQSVAQAEAQASAEVA
jgi:hypothetical protein